MPQKWVFLRKSAPQKVDFSADQSKKRPPKRERVSQIWEKPQIWTLKIASKSESYLKFYENFRKNFRKNFEKFEKNFHNLAQRF